MGTEFSWRGPVEEEADDLPSPGHHHSLFSSFVLFLFLFSFIALKTAFILYLFIVHLPYQNDNAIKIEYLVIFFIFAFLTCARNSIQIVE